MADCLLEVGVMSHEAESADSVSGAIGKFREQMLFWIDTELARQQERGPAENAAGAGSAIALRTIRSGRRGGSHLASQSDHEGVSLGYPDFPSEMGRELPRDPDRSADRNATAEIKAASDEFPGPDTLDPQAPPLNSRQRLDALARLLDRRLKQVGQAAGTSRGSAGERNEDIQHDSPAHSDRWVAEWTSDAD
jgi:hypothetical protein